MNMNGPSGRIFAYFELVHIETLYEHEAIRVKNLYKSIHPIHDFTVIPDNTV